MAEHACSMRVTVFVDGLEVDAELGVHAHERGHRRPIIVDIEAGVEVPLADCLVATVDYAGIVALVEAIAVEGHVELVETLACRIAERILASGEVLEVFVRVSKPGAVPQARTVGATAFAVRGLENGRPISSRPQTREPHLRRD